MQRARAPQDAELRRCRHRSTVQPVVPPASTALGQISVSAQYHVQRMCPPAAGMRSSADAVTRAGTSRLIAEWSDGSETQAVLCQFGLQFCVGQPQVVARPPRHSGPRGAVSPANVRPRVAPAKANFPRRRAAPESTHKDSPARPPQDFGRSSRLRLLLNRRKHVRKVLQVQDLALGTRGDRLLDRHVPTPSTLPGQS